MRSATRPFLIILVGYVVIYLLVDDAPLYIIGGSIVGLVKELFNVSSNVGLLTWIGLLATSTVAFFAIKNKSTKYVVLVILFTLLYVVDFLFAEILSYDVVIKRMIYTSIIILIKSLVLTLIIYFERKRKVASKVIN